MRKEPHHFSFEDFFKALFGAFFVGLTFLFKGAMRQSALAMSKWNVIMVVGLALIIVSIEIYILSYRFVKNKSSRPFYEFWAKRFFAITISTFLSLYLAVYIYGLDSMDTWDTLRLTSAVFLPAAIFGAALEMLKRKR